MRHYIPAWLEGSKKVVKELIQEMTLVWIFKSKLFTELTNQGRTFQGTACLQAKLESVVSSICGVPEEKQETRQEAAQIESRRS